MRWIQTHTAKGRLRTRRLNPAGFSFGFCRAVRMIKLTETQEITPCGCVRMATIDGDVDLGEARDESIRRRE
jgi:hypothetical protein